MIPDILEKIEDIVWQFDISYTDAIVYYCEQNNVEIESFARTIKNNETMRAKLQFEAEELNYLPKSNTLPIF